MRYASEEREWLKNNYSMLGVKETTRLFNEIFGHSCTNKAIGRYCNVSLGIKVSAETTSRLLSQNHNHGCRNVKGRRFYEEEEKKWLIENYPKLGIMETTKQFNEKFGHNKNHVAIKRYCRHHLNLAVPKEVTISLRTAPVGYMYKNCRGEWRIKTEEGWKPLSHAVKEVPKGYVALHLDGDKDNNTPENIAVVRNGIQTIARNCNLISENPTITSVGLTWSELYSVMKKQKGDIKYAK